MSTSDQPSPETDDVDPEEQDLLDVAAMDVPSADVARRALMAEYDYSEEELP